MAVLAALDGERALAETLTSIDTMDVESTAMVMAWRCGYDDALAASLFPSGTELSPEAVEAHRRLFSDRNASMTEVLLQLMERGGTYFVVTGAGHMLGADGIPARLRAQGFPVERR